MLRHLAFRSLSREARPLLAIIAALLVAGILVFNIYFTQLNTQWLLFLAGVLLAAILAEATRMYRAEWIVLRRTAQLSQLKNKLTQETQLRKHAEEALLEAKQHLYLMDSVSPIMILLVDTAEICHYHNRAFLEWLHLRPSQVEGKHLREVLGIQMAREVSAANRKLLTGHAVQYQREQTMPDGSFYQLAIKHAPKFDVAGKIVGFYMLISDITRAADVRDAGYLQPERVPQAAALPTATDELSDVSGEEDSTGRMKNAIEKGEFRLFSQLIRPLSANADEVAHYEILIRLLEEEESMMPPGAFFPLAEKYGLMSHLDRWVVQHVIEWVAHQIGRGTHIEGSMFFINLADTTIADVDFPAFVQSMLLTHVVAGEHLCFEVPDAEWAAHRVEVVRFMQEMRQLGCRIALSGFGQGQTVIDQQDALPVDFLKIDGSIVLEILRDPAALATVAAIEQFAQEKSIQTIAEFVEYESIIDQLKMLGIDFAQGFGISHPLPLAEQFAEEEPTP